jgi:hypothetical protein
MFHVAISHHHLPLLSGLIIATAYNDADLQHGTME